MANVFESAGITENVDLDVLAAIQDGFEVAIVVLEIGRWGVAGEACEGLTEGAG